MNIANTLPEPVNQFQVDVPANTYYDFELEAGSTYPLSGVTYPVDYGNIPGYIAEDQHELDLYVGNTRDGLSGYFVVDRGKSIPDEHKYYTALTEGELTAILNELKPVLLKQEAFPNVDALLKHIETYKVNK